MLSLLLSDNLRSKIYIDIFKKQKIFFDFIFLYNSKKKINYPYCNKIYYFKEKIANQNIKNKITEKKIKNIIISPSDGEILNYRFLKNLNIFHCHPGKLPDFKGSCTIYYSILETKKIYCSVLMMNEKIDEGKIIFLQKQKKPNWKKTYYAKYDYTIRAKTLVNFIKRKNKNTHSIKQDFKLPYYIPHPVIRTLAINKNIVKKLVR